MVRVGTSEVRAGHGSTARRAWTTVRRGVSTVRPAGIGVHGPEALWVSGPKSYRRPMALIGQAGKSPRTRTPVHPGRKRLGAAVAMVMLGSFMPWISTGLGNVSGAGGPGIWTFYASLLGLGAALLPFRRIGALQAAILSGVAIGLPVWQLVRVFDKVGFGGWMPGPGLVLVLGGGVLAGVAAAQLYRQHSP